LIDKLKGTPVLNGNTYSVLIETYCGLSPGLIGGIVGGIIGVVAITGIVIALIVFYRRKKEFREMNEKLEKFAKIKAERTAKKPETTGVLDI